jgi:hypothetical protein
MPVDENEPDAGEPQAVPGGASSDRVKVTSSKEGRITIDVQNEDLARVMTGISAATGANVIVSPDVHEPVAVSLRDIPGDQAIEVIARMTRCEVETLPGGVRFLVQPPKVTIEFKEGNVRTILQLLSAYSGKTILIGPNVRGRIQMDFREVRWKRALSAIVKSAKLALTWVGELPLVTATPLPESALPTARTPVVSLPEGTRAEHVNLDVNGVDLADICDQLGRQVKRNILVDPNVDERVTISLRDLPWNDAITALCRVTRCEAEMRPGGIVLLSQPPRVTFAVRNAPAKALYGLLASYSGKNISIGEDVRGEITANATRIHWLQLLEGLAAIYGHKIDRETQDIFALTRGDWAEGWESVSVPPKSTKPLQLTGIVHIDDGLSRSAALVDGYVIHEGDPLLDANGGKIEGRVVKVETNRVRFRYKKADVIRTLD